MTVGGGEPDPPKPLRSRLRPSQSPHHTRAAAGSHAPGVIKRHRRGHLDLWVTWSENTQPSVSSLHHWLRLKPGPGGRVRTGSTAGEHGPDHVKSVSSNENTTSRWHDCIPEADSGFKSLTKSRSAEIGTLLMTELLLRYGSALDITILNAV